MGFKLKCPMSGCNAELTADNKDDLLKQGMEHAKTHGMAGWSHSIARTCFLSSRKNGKKERFLLGLFGHVDDLGFGCVVLD